MNKYQHPKNVTASGGIIVVMSFVFGVLSYIYFRTFIINDPLATINSYNKLKTHKLLRKYFPESYIVNKTNFNQIYLKIKSKEWVVIKRNKGLHGEGVFKIKPSQIKKYLGKESMILQDYIEPKMGIGRCLCLNYKNNFKEIATYSRFPEKTWKTGTNSNSKIKKIKTNEKLYEFCKKVSKKSKLFINGIDFIESDGKYYLLEINSVPRISTVKSKFGINSPKIILDFIESNIKL